MTYSDVIALGSGKFSFRLTIEGFHLEAVTSAAMEKAASGSNRARRVGLSVRGVKISQRADLPRATIEAESATFELVDYDDVWTAAFAADPAHTTWLGADAIGSFSSLTVDSTDGWPDEGFLWLSSEVIRYASKTSTSFGTLTRAQYNTISQDHYTWGGARLGYPEITSSHTILQGRRVRLFAYGEGDDMQGDGQQIWLGIMSGEPRMQGPSWSVSADPITALLEQDLGADLGPPLRPRGIFIPGPFSASFFVERITSTPSATPRPIPNQWLSTRRDPAAPTTSISFFVQGFFETQADFVAELNAKISAVTATWASTITAHVGTGPVAFAGGDLSETSGYHFKAYIPPVSVAGETVNIRNTEYIAETEPTYGLCDDGFGRPESLTTGGREFYWRPSQSGDGRRRVPIENAGIVPRGMFVPADLVGTISLPTGPLGIWEPGDARIYVDSDLAVTPNATAASLTINQDEYRTVKIEAVDAAAGYIDVTVDESELGSERDDGALGSGILGVKAFAGSSSLSLLLGRTLNTVVPTGIGTYSLLKGLETDVPSQVNVGALPMFQPGDWNETEWLIGYGGSTEYSRLREYMTVEAVPFGEIVSPDLQLASLYLALDSSGRMTVKRLRLATITDVGVGAIDKTFLLTDDDFPQYNLGAIGAYNQIDIRDGYNARTDEYEGTPVRVRDVKAFGRNPSTRSLQIKPKSRYGGGRFVPPEDAVRIATNVLGIYGTPYAYVTCDVPLQWLDVTLGLTVSFNTKQLPSRDGKRGMENVVGVVVAREIDLYAARITLTVLTSPSRISGYAWGGRIEMATATNVSGDIWDINLEPGLYYAAGTLASDYLKSDDAIFVYVWDSTSSTTVSGTVGAVSGDTVRVKFDSTWTPGSDEWAIAFDDHSGANPLTANQKRFAYIASSDSRVFGSSPARVFSPG